MRSQVNLSWMWANRSRMATTAQWLMVVSVAALLATPSMQGQTYTVLYSFTGTNGDGAFPRAGLAMDAKGNLYGATENGGTGTCVESYRHDGCGTVFMIDPSGQETVLYSFPKKFPGGAYPDAGIMRDIDGILYGTTSAGGRINGGTVFELRSNGKELAYGFPDATGGSVPNGLSRNPAGGLFGTTAAGGDLTCNAPNGCGTVFELDPTGAETVLYTFTGGTDGSVPSGATPGGLAMDPAGNLYGTTSQGGDANCVVNGSSCGTVFALDTAGNKTVLHAFTGYPKDGALPSGGLLRDQLGDLFGTTIAGGAHGYGSVFKLNAQNKQSILYSFLGHADGQYPNAGVVRDNAGSVYGTTSAGGDHTCSVHGSKGCGVLFKLALDGTETALHTFAGSPTDGANPQGLVHDAAGNYYGTTYYGGAFGYGTVFKITP